MSDPSAEREIISLYSTSPNLREIDMIGFRAIKQGLVSEVVDRARDMGLFQDILTDVTGEDDPVSYDTATVRFSPPAPRADAEALGFMVATAAGGVEMLDLFGANFDNGHVGERTIAKVPVVPVQPAA